MGSFPSAALQIKQQPSFLQQAGEAMQLKSLAGQQQIQQLTVQQMQQQMEDKHKISQAYMQNNGDMDATIESVRKAGLNDPNQLIELQKQNIAQKTAIQGLKDKEVATHQATVKALGDAAQSILALPDELQPAAYQRKTQELSQQIGLDPKQIPPYDKNTVRMMAAESMGLKALLDTESENRMKAAQLLTAQSNATVAQQEAALTPQERAGLKSPEFAQQTAWLNRPENKGKDPADFLAWKAKQSPMALVMGNQLGTGNALDQQAELYSQTHELPQGLSRSPGTTSAIIRRAAELHPEQNLAANQAEFKSLQGSLSKVQSTFSQMSAFEGTALKNLDLYASTLKNIPDLGFKAGNTPLRLISKNIIGDANYSAMEAARQTAAAEVAKVLGSATGSGVLSDTQKKEAQDVINGNLPLKSTLRVIDTLKQDMANRHQSYQMQIDDLKGKLGQKPGASNAPPAATKGGLNIGDPVTIKGKPMKVTAVHPDGSFDAQ